MPDKFLVVKRGYSIEEVDLYVTDVERKLAHYKKREAAVTNAIVSAEEAAEQIIKNAEEQAKEMVAECETELNDIRKMVDSEKKALAEFCSEYDSIVRKYFSGTSEEITAPLKEKIELLGELIREKEEQKNRYIENGGNSSDSTEYETSGEEGTESD